MDPDPYSQYCVAVPEPTFFWPKLAPNQIFFKLYLKSVLFIIAKVNEKNALCQRFGFAYIIMRIQIQDHLDLGPEGKKLNKNNFLKYFQVSIKEFR